jgi:hypothetical protein
VVEPNFTYGIFMFIWRVRVYYLHACVVHFDWPTMWLDYLRAKK